MSLLAGQTKSEAVTGAPTSFPLGANTLLVGVLAVTALMFLPSLRYEFTYDDLGQIIDNPTVHAWRFVPEYFQGHVWEYLAPNAVGNYYRPLNVLWFRINDAVFGLKPMGWHATTLALHLLATALVFAIARRITGRALLAAIAALLFGIHPTRHEVVAWVSGSTESLCAVFFLSSFFAYLLSRERRTVVWMSASCLLYAAGLLAKETAIVLPSIIAVHALLYGLREGETAPAGLWQRLFQAAARASLYAPFAILYLVQRIHVLHGFSHPSTTMSPLTLFLTLPSVLFFYLKQWLLPIRVSEFYDLFVRTRWDVVHVLLPLIGLVVAATALWYFRRKLGARDLAFALAATLIPLAPVLYLPVFTFGELVHDRYLYLPGFGAALLAALACEGLCRGQLVFGLPRRLVLVMLAIVLPISYSTASASSYWVNNYELFDHARRLAPENPLAMNNYAVELDHEGQQGTAIEILQKVVDQHPKDYLPVYNLGRVLYEVNLLGPADHYLQVARNLQPDKPEAFLQMGLVSLKLGRMDDALFNFKYAVALGPHDPKAHFSLGVVYAQRKDCGLARAQFAEALSLQPTFVKAQQQMDKCVAPAPANEPQLPVAGGVSQGPAPLLDPVARLPLHTVKGP